MRAWLAVVLLGAAVALSGCASHVCGGRGGYENAPTAPPLKAPPGLQVPKPDSSTVIPDVPAPKGRSLRERADGTCLAIPPPFHPPAKPSGGHPRSSGGADAGSS